MIGLALQIFVAWFYSHVLEYFLHKHVLHNSKIKPAFKHHYRYHHFAAKRTAMLDTKYIKNRWYEWLWDDEIVGLSFLAVIHLPVAWFFPYAYLFLFLSAIQYFVVHRLAHRNYHWARKYLSHHYDHHMGIDQNVNWGVRASWPDRLFGTRVVYKGTKREIMQYKKTCSAEKRGVRVRSRRN